MGFFEPKNTHVRKFHKICPSDFSEILCDGRGSERCKSNCIFIFQGNFDYV